MTRLTVILCLLLGMCGCTDDNTARSSEGAVEVEFILGGITAVGAPGQWQMRAATPEVMMDGTTVRVLAYKRSGTSASLIAANYVRECTYKVTNSGTTLTPCAVNSDGTVNGSGAKPVAIMLLPGEYDFYTVTPALPVNQSTGNTPTISVGHGTDYAVSLTNKSVTPGNVPVTLNMLERRCAQLRFRTEQALGAMSSIMIDKVVVTNMTATPQFFSGISTPTFTAGSAEFEIPGSAFTGSGNVWASQTVVLPKTAAAFTVKVVARFNGASNTVVNYEETVAATALEGGKSYGYVLKFNGYGMEVVPDNMWDHVAMGEDEFGYHNLNESGTKEEYANCYIVAGNTVKNFSFDATKRGNNSIVSGIDTSVLPDLSTAKVARVIWQTGTSASDLVVEPTSVKLESGKVYFSTGSAPQGNAVIGIFASPELTTECLWSWHIWRLASEPEPDITCTRTPATTAYPTVYQMMPYDLGAFSNTVDDISSVGLLYQWGRKDPFPGTGTWSGGEPNNVYGTYLTASNEVGKWEGAYKVSTVWIDTTVGTETWAVQHPAVFIKNNSNTYRYDWVVIRNDALWGTPWLSTGANSCNTNQGIKSIYDPCPVGYRVPPQDFATNASIEGWTTSGLTMSGISNNFWLPCGGRRENDSGSLNLVTDYYGIYYASSPKSLEFYSARMIFIKGKNSLEKVSNSYRAFACSVRCVSESIAIPI
ncbi:fimbrillin family protein [Bacteroides sp.]